MTQQELFPSNIARAYRMQLAKAIKTLPADQKVKAAFYDEPLQVEAIALKITFDHRSTNPPRMA